MATPYSIKERFQSSRNEATLPRARCWRFEAGAFRKTGYYGSGEESGALAHFFGRSISVKPSSELLFAVIPTATRATGWHASSGSPADTTGKDRIFLQVDSLVSSRRGFDGCYSYPRL